MEDFDVTQMNLEDLRQVDIRTVNPDSLVDINDIKINTNLPREERIVDFIRQIGNPYCFRCGKVVVKISFKDTDVTMEERMENLLRMI
ncbi:hypothetical protein Ami103574_09795 [Aminipila butyrica]|uniref:DUF6870 domain-containing protein n=1 Tax=Aminipila butyrica TaxID=433296 RepID=A0A858BWX2_9FIRM|nr:hypothetical protein [Aminipila butyrica]QIB69608.1 hypothetical protein Ami103574_09795 [Aminipila butyrica]